MAYCTHCGTQLGEGDRFCAKCGASQSATPPPVPDTQHPTPDTGGASRPGLRPNVAALLCYIPGLGWIASVIFLSADPYRRNRYVRFHAMQGLFLSAIYLLTQWVFVPLHGPFFPFHWLGFRGILKLAVLIAQIIGIVKTARNEDYRLPLLSELAEKSMV